MISNLEKYVSNAGRPLPVFLLLDKSGSMSGEKIAVLNSAVKDMIEDFKSENLSEVQLQLCVISFGSSVDVEIPLTNVYEIQYKDLYADGMTPLGQALTKASDIINDKEQVSSKGYRPVVVLVSDGYPNDNWEAPLDKFISEGRTKKCDRWAMGIGDGADYNMLQRFLGNDEKRVFKASEAKEIHKFFKFVTMSTIARSKSVNPNETLDINNLNEMFDNQNPNFDFD